MLERDGDVSSLPQSQATIRYVQLCKKSFLPDRSQREGSLLRTGLQHKTSRFFLAEER